MIEIIGWIGCLLLALCGIPQAVKSVREKHSDGVSWMFLLMWAAGEVLGVSYVLALMNYPLIFNYATNVICVGVILYFKMKPSRIDGCE